MGLGKWLGTIRSTPSPVNDSNHSCYPRYSIFTGVNGYVLGTCYAVIRPFAPCQIAKTTRSSLLLPGRTTEHPQSLASRLCQFCFLPGLSPERPWSWYSTEHHTAPLHWQQHADWIWWAASIKYWGKTLKTRGWKVSPPTRNKVSVMNPQDERHTTSSHKMLPQKKRHDAQAFLDFEGNIYCLWECS